MISLCETTDEWRWLAELHVHMTSKEVILNYEDDVQLLDGGKVETFMYNTFFTSTITEICNSDIIK